jgi:hypothetical protein
MKACVLRLARRAAPCDAPRSTRLGARHQFSSPASCRASCHVSVITTVFADVPAESLGARPVQDPEATGRRRSTGHAGRAGRCLATATGRPLNGGSWACTAGRDRATLVLHQTAKRGDYEVLILRRHHRSAPPYCFTGPFGVFSCLTQFGVGEWLPEEYDVSTSRPCRRPARRARASPPCSPSPRTP